MLICHHTGFRFETHKTHYGTPGPSVKPKKIEKEHMRMTKNLKYIVLIVDQN